MAISSTQSQIIHRATWAALFAMLLIVVAPLISISLHNARVVDTAAQIQTFHHHEMPAHQNQVEHVHSPGLSMVDHAEACGYCVLLSHVPGVLLFVLWLVYGLLGPPERINPPYITSLYRRVFWLRPTPRAPPVKSAFSLY